MKKLFVLLACSLAFAASAQEPPKVDWQTKCESASRLAKTIMEGRLAGVSMSEMMSIAKEGGLSHTMIIEAYDSPRYQTPAMQRRAVEEFRDKWYLLCVKALRE